MEIASKLPLVKGGEKRMNVKIVIDEISSESMFDEMVRELGYLFKNNCILQRRGFDIQWGKRW